MFVLYFDSKYYHWAPQLIGSIKKFEPSELIMTFGINLTPDQAVKSDRTSAFHLNVSVPPQPEEEVPFQVIERKAEYLIDAIASFPTQKLFIMMDIDMLLLRPLTEVKEAMLDHKFDFAAILANPDKICGGFYAFRKTSVVMDLLDEWNEFLMDGKFYYDKDQPSLALLVRKYQFEHGLKVLPLTRGYLDYKSREGSHIWSAHKSEFGEKHNRFELYQKVSKELGIK